MLGTRDIYFALHFDGDPDKNASQQVRDECVQLQKELEDRLEQCLTREQISKEKRNQIESLTEIWMSEMVEHDGGDKTTC